jgi:hypothetical protein
MQHQFSAPTPDLLERFWSHVHKTDGCWLWTGGKDRDGYGMFTQDDTTIKAHRFSWFIHNGPIQSQRFVCHTCDSPDCIRPDHLFLGDPKDNSGDMVSKSRQAAGQRSGKNKLTNEQVEYIRSIPGHRGLNTELATLYGVDKGTIGLIRNNRTWRHLL